MQLRSSFEPMAWPAVATGTAADLLALQRQFDASQWWPPAQLQTQQFRQLRLLLSHAQRHIPFYTERLRRAGIGPNTVLDATSWARIPTLTRRDVQSQGEALHARVIPPSHGASTEATSGGSSGMPVRVKKTALATLIWNAIQVREEIWHRENPRGTIARIRRAPRDVTPREAAMIARMPGLTIPDHGPPNNLLWETGRVHLLDDRVAIIEQAILLRQVQPEYIQTFPANLRLLLAHFRATPRPLPKLRAVWTLSEVVDDSLRALCQEIFGCPIVHNYTAAETGYMALQCPEHMHFHVQSEAVYLEVLHADGSACAPGEIGTVVVTPLHNFATPLLRYALGDEAEVGAPCACGRGLPVLRRIVGREFDYLTFPDGRRRRVDTGYYRISAIPAVREFQIVQRALDRIELLLVLARPLTDAEDTTIRDVLATEFGREFGFDISVHHSIARTAVGKLRAFISDLPPMDEFIPNVVDTDSHQHRRHGPRRRTIHGFFCASPKAWMIRLRGP